MKIVDVLDGIVSCSLLVYLGRMRQSLDSHDLEASRHNIKYISTLIIMLTILGIIKYNHKYWLFWVVRTFVHILTIILAFGIARDQDKNIKHIAVKYRPLEILSFIIVILTIIMIIPIREKVLEK